MLLPCQIARWYIISQVGKGTEKRAFISYRTKLCFELFLSKDLEFAISSLADLRFPPGLFIWNACRDLFQSLQNKWNISSFIRSLWWCNDYNEVQNWKGFFCPLTYSLHEISWAAFGTPSEFLTTWERDMVIEHNSCFLPIWSIFNPLPQVFFTFPLLHDLLNLFFYYILKPTFCYWPLLCNPFAFFCL